MRYPPTLGAKSVSFGTRGSLGAAGAKTRPFPMDVRCEQCQTEYEFDDALVSGRGTTVKCTNCGHKFKIRRRDGDFSEDFWNVHTADNKTLVFTSLRELQRAIQGRVVHRTDMMSKGGHPPKPIGQIPELAPFFVPRTTRDFGEAMTPSQPPPLPATSQAPPPPLPPPSSSKRDRSSTQPGFPPASSTLGALKKTLVGPGDDLAAIARSVIEQSQSRPPPVRPSRPAAHSLPPAQSRPPPLPSSSPSQTPPMTRSRTEPPPPTDRAPPNTERMARRRSIPPPLPETPSHRPQKDTQPIHAPFEVSSPLPPPTPVVLRTMGYDPDEAVRDAMPTLSDAPPSMGKRRSVGGFVVAVVVLLGVGMIGAVWARDHLGVTLGINKPVVQTPVRDPRVTELLAVGDKALLDGNLDLSQQNFLKASALAEKDPQVLLALSRLAAVRADEPWLRMRLLPSDATDERRLAKERLGELAQGARKAADDAVLAAPDDLAAVRAKVDGLRISGDREGARALVGRIQPTASTPETAYVLAALDLAEPEPLWSTVVERLRLAATGESGTGRARAALIYALVQSGDTAGAKVELDRLAAMPRPHPLLGLLRSIVDHAPAPIAKLDAGVLDASVAGLDKGDKPAKGDKPDKGDRPLSGDPRVLVSQAEKARGRGEYERARSLYSAALEHDPGDTEALNGLAAIAHAQRDLNGARNAYKRVLSINPNYVPALVGAADVDWESGDRASAMRSYKDIVDRFPEGTYPPRVRQRLEAAAPAPAPAPSPAPTEPGGTP